MFFIGIFGIEDNEKELREFPNIVCPDCGGYSRAVLILHYTCLQFFFIPTFRWNKRWTVRVRGCGVVYEADAEYGKQLEAGAELDFSRLKKVSSGFGGFGGEFYATCANCGRAFDPSFAYCPHCGAKK
jgi:DNA-directed RNA polymerase subunit RPC12/RpoP